VKAGAVWSILSFAITKGLAFVALLVLTRILAPAQFGIVAGVVVVLSIIELTSDLGMGATVIYEQEQGVSERVQVAFTVNMVLVVLLAAVGLLIAPLIASYFHASSHVWLFRLSILDVVLTGLGSIHNALLLRDLRFSARIVTQVISAVVRAGTGIALALLGFGAASLVWGLLLGTAAWTASLWWVTGFRPRLRFDRRIAASMIGYGVGASVFEFVDQAVAQVDTAVVGRVLGPRALGLYTVAFRVPTLVLENIAAQVSLVVFPVLARKRVADERGVGASTSRVVRYQALYALPLGAGLAIMARPLVGIVFSSKWQAASGVFAAVSVMSGISASGFALGDALKALARQRLLVWLTLIQFPLLLVTIILVAPYGITAVAWARAGGTALWLGLVIAAAARVMATSVSRTLASMWPGVAAAAGVAAVDGAVRAWSGLPALPEVIVAILAGLGGATVALAALSPSTLRELRAGLRTIKTERRSATS
jgi:PST family polysaccharide transporter